MGKQTSAKPDFHTIVKLEMSQRGWGMRTLARTLAGDGASHEQVEIERRAVRRWLGGAQPSQANRRRVAAALGLPEQLFDDEAEEESLSAILHREVELATMRATRKWEQRQLDLTGARS